MRKTYAGNEVDVSFDPEVCTHAAKCVNGLPAVFDTKRRRWIDSDNEAGCPDANGVTVLDDWAPTDLPSGSSYDGGHYWAVKPVIIPARVFAGSSSIDIPISLIDRFGPPGNCGLPPAGAGVTESCKVRASWQGLLTLHRIS